MVVWHSFLPFGLSIAICVFVSWKSVENQLELREAGRTGGDSEVRRRCGEEGEEERGGGDEVDEATSTTQLGPYRHRPPRTASELRARLQTLAKMPPGPRRLARGKALALAAEHALREASPEAEGGGNGNAENDDGEEIVFVESNAAAALRQTLPWLDARLAALASEDVRAIGCGLCGICAGHEDACATHAWPCGVAGGGTEGGGGRGGGGRGEGNQSSNNDGGNGGLLAALFGSSSQPSFSPYPSRSTSSINDDSVYATSGHRACGRCAARCGSKCPFCRGERGAPRLAFLLEG